MTGRRVLWMGLDPDTVDFQSDFLRGRAITRKGGYEEP